jgi:hypothetical protein
VTVRRAASGWPPTRHGHRDVTTSRHSAGVFLAAAPQRPTDARGAGAPAHQAVLALLRHGSGPRPRFDPGLSGGLRAWLEDAAAELVEDRGEDAPALFLGPRRLLGDPAAAAAPRMAHSVGHYPTEWVRSCLVRALFRQLVTAGCVSDPLTDAVDALRVDPRRAGMVQHIDGLNARERAALSASLAGHAAHLVDLTPRFAPGWLPRTGDRVTIPLAGGRVMLGGTFDLLVGAPVPGTSTLCAVGLTTGGRWAQARATLHYLALLETLRSGTPPYRMALLHSAAGHYGVEDVTEEHLRVIVSQVAGRLPGLGRADA